MNKRPVASLQIYDTIEIDDDITSFFSSKENQSILQQKETEKDARSTETVKLCCFCFSMH